MTVDSTYAKFNPGNRRGLKYRFQAIDAVTKEYVDDTFDSIIAVVNAHGERFGLTRHMVRGIATDTLGINAALKYRHIIITTISSGT